MNPCCWWMTSATQRYGSCMVVSIAWLMGSPAGCSPEPWWPLRRTGSGSACSFYHDPKVVWTSGVRRAGKRRSTISTCTGRSTISTCSATIGYPPSWVLQSAEGLYNPLALLQSLPLPGYFIIMDLALTWVGSKLGYHMVRNIEVFFSMQSLAVLWSDIFWAIAICPRVMAGLSVDSVELWSPYRLWLWMICSTT